MQKYSIFYVHDIYIYICGENPSLNYMQLEFNVYIHFPSCDINKYIKENHKFYNFYLKYIHIFVCTVLSTFILKDIFIWLLIDKTPFIMKFCSRLVKKKKL